MSTWNIEASRNEAAVPQWRTLVETVLFATLTLMLLALFHELVERFFWRPNSWRVPAPFAVSLVAAVALARVRYSAFGSLLGLTLRISTAGILFSLLFEAPDYTLANPDGAALAARFVSWGYWPALACAALSLWRPSFAVPGAMFILSARKVVEPISGLPMAFTDMSYMIDMTLYTALFGLGLVLLRPRVNHWLTDPEREAELVGVAFGLHLANYFWSAIAKAVLGPTPWYWVFNNQTFDQMPYTLEAGIHPLGAWPWLMQLAYDGLVWACVPLNGIILLAQLFALVCVLRKSWLKIAAVLYDLLHIGIYVFGGLFFWPWIWNNVTVLVVAGRQKGDLGAPLKAACITTILLGAPFLHLNQAAWLGWLDVNAARQIYFAAVTKDGRDVKVPSAFFLSHSYSVSHGYMGAFPKPGHYEATMLASTDDYERHRVDDTCPDPATMANNAEVEAAGRREERTSTLQRFLKAHHQKMLERASTLGNASFYVHLCITIPATRCCTRPSTASI